MPSTDLIEAAKLWVRAEWAFRFGPRCYTAWAQDALIRAEDGLRAALTDHSALSPAAASLGVETSLGPRPLAPEPEGQDEQEEAPVTACNPPLPPRKRLSLFGGV